MANRDLEALKAAQLAYERSNASLKDYNPEALDDDDKVYEDRRTHDISEPVLSRAEDSAALVDLDGSSQDRSTAAAELGGDDNSKSQPGVASPVEDKKTAPESNKFNK